MPFAELLEDMTITVEDVAKKLEKLNPTNSLGPDKMHPQVLRELCKVIADPLENLFKLSMDTGILGHGQGS